MAQGICINCKKEYKNNSHAKTKFCSRICMGKNKDNREKISKANKGKLAWNKGKPAPWARVDLLVPAKRGKKHPFWKGDMVGYSALHNWIRVRLAKPLGCNDCGEIKPLDLANKSGKYKRELDDWLWLCRKCHAKKDDYVNKSWKTRKLKYGYSGRRVAKLPM